MVQASLSVLGSVVALRYLIKLLKRSLYIDLFIKTLFLGPGYRRYFTHRQAPATGRQVHIKIIKVKKLFTSDININAFYYCCKKLTYLRFSHQNMFVVKSIFQFQGSQGIYNKTTFTLSLQQNTPSHNTRLPTCGT